MVNVYLRLGAFIHRKGQVLAEWADYLFDF